MKGRSRIALRVGVATVFAGALGVAIGALIALRVARDVVTPPRRLVYDVPVLAVDRAARTVLLGRTPDTAVAGRYSLRFDEERGHARVGDILAMDDSTVLRRLEGVDRGDLERASTARWSAWWYQTPVDLGVPYRDVGLETTVGVAPAWLVEPEGGDAASPWLIAVHGRGVTRAEPLRAVPVFRSAGYRCLLISYRNDGEAPHSRDGRYALGGEEWRDVEAAIAYALQHGATRIVLMGWSMGGATALQCLLHSTLAEHVDGLVLESPVVDWLTVLHFQARLVGLPPAVRDAALAILGSRQGASIIGLESPIDFARLDIVARAAEIPVPLLVLHSDDDGFVPSDGSVALAAARPDVVRLERFTRARHTKLWNYDRERWERAISTWLVDQGLAEANAAVTTPTTPVTALTTGRTARPHRRPTTARGAID